MQDQITKLQNKDPNTQLTLLIPDGKEIKLKSPGAQMANKGVNSYESHMGNATPAHLGSKNSNPPNAAKGENAGIHGTLHAGSGGKHPMDRSMTAY